MCVGEVVSFVLVKLYVEAVTYLIFIFTANGILERLTGQLVSVSSVVASVTSCLWKAEFTEIHS